MRPLGGRPTMTTWSENSGESLADAVVIDAPSEAAGVRAEYRWLEEHYGRRGVDWELEMQALLRPGDHPYDRLDVQLADGRRVSIYFDISGFFGRL